MDMNLSKLWEIVDDREARRPIVHGVTKRHDLVTEQQQGRWLVFRPCCLPILCLHHRICVSLKISVM